MSVQAQAEVKAAPAPVPALTPAPAEYAPHTCACGGSHGLGGECGECRRKRLRVQRRALNAPEFSVMQMALAPHSVLGHDFGRMSVRARVPTAVQGGPEQRDEREADRAAKQVAQGITPALNRPSAPLAIRRSALDEETSAESTIEPEAQTTEAAGPAVAAAMPEAASPETEPTPASEPAATTETPTGEPQSGALIVEDDASPGPGQMSKNAFLDELRTSACAAADAELAAVGRSTEGCPYVERLIAHYRTQDSRYVERAIRKYAPETAGVTSAREYIAPVSERIRLGTARWAQSGDLSGAPEELLSQASGAGLLAGIGSAVSSAVGSVSGLFFKARAGGAKEAAPQAIRSQLKGGKSLESSVRTRMESAFGYDFSRVRVHTDGQAANLSSSLNARAFTVGSDVAFGAGEYQPGTLVGDALLAHELAHVVQQGGAGSSSALMQKGDGAYNALEEDADVSAVGAVVSLWSGVKGGLAKVAQSAMPRMRSGLRLSRCKNQQSTPTGTSSSAPASTPTTTPSATPAAVPRLRKTTVSGPTTGNCGQYSWGIRWSLENADATTQGWIVQNINSSHDVKGCDDRSKTDDEMRTLTGGWDPSWYPFWEAWQVRDGQIYVGRSDSIHSADTFGWSGPGDNTKGSREVRGAANFYPNRALPASFVVRNAAPAWSLPYTQTDEHLTGGTGSLTHNITATWNCCPRADGTKDRRTTVSTV